MMYGRGVFGNGGCLGYGLFSSGWSWLIGIGIALIVIAGIYFLVKKNRKAASNYNALESLKMKYSKGEVTEEEYKKRKSILEEK